MGTIKIADPAACLQKTALCKGTGGSTILAWVAPDVCSNSAANHADEKLKRARALHHAEARGFSMISCPDSGPPAHLRGTCKFFASSAFP